MPIARLPKRPAPPGANRPDRDIDDDPVDELMTIAEAIGYDRDSVMQEVRRLWPTVGKRGACVSVLDRMLAREPLEAGCVRA